MICVAASGTHELCTIETAQIAERACAGGPCLPCRAPGRSIPAWARACGGAWRCLARAARRCGRGGTAYVAQYFSDSLAVVALIRLADPVAADDRLGAELPWTHRAARRTAFRGRTLCYQKLAELCQLSSRPRGDASNWDLMNDGIGNPKSSKSMLFSHVTPPAMAQGVRETAEEAVRSGLKNILFTNRREEEAAAIDAYLKSLTPVPSPHLQHGELSESAQRGQQLVRKRRSRLSSLPSRSALYRLPDTQHRERPLAPVQQPLRHADTAGNLEDGTLPESGLLHDDSRSAY